MEQILKKCRCCGRELSLGHFKRGRYGYVSVCLDCDKQHRAEKRQARIDEQKKKVEDVRAENRQLRLDDFTPRELIAQLKKLGYEGRLTYTKVETIDLSRFLGDVSDVWVLGGTFVRPMLKTTLNAK